MRGAVHANSPRCLAEHVTAYMFRSADMALAVVPRINL